MRVEGCLTMKIPVMIDGKKYKLSYFQWLAYENQKKIDRIEKKLDRLLDQGGNQCADKSTSDGDNRTN